LTSWANKCTSGAIKRGLRLNGRAEEVAEKLFNRARSLPQALKRKHIFKSLAARLEVVPFPLPGESEFFLSL
jgi:hypothetical protein